MLEQEPIITIKQGKLRGKIGTDCNGKQYFGFLGIPYAKPPIGDLRFKAPQPADSWTGTRDATKEGNPCFAQDMVLRTLVGSEDCLFLNVYTPELPAKHCGLKPVMVWIHGGGFTSGSGGSDMYGPEFLIPHDVVVVSINYRLGLLGFLNFEDSSIGVPGNAGLKDQVLALQWVKENISNFNGDPNNVTIFGESAGAASVHHLVLTPMAKGLFHKAIIQSGCAISVWAKGKRSLSHLAKALGRESATEKEIYNILKNMSKEEIYGLQIQIPDKPLSSHIRLIGPVVETSTNEPSFLQQDPLDIIASGNYSQVPMIFGYCSREGMLIQIFARLRKEEFKLETNFKLHIPHTFKVNDDKTMEEISSKIKTFYYGNEEPTLENIDQNYLLDTDNFFLRPLFDSVRNHLNTASKPVYLYRLSADSSLNLFKRFGQIKHPGVAHGDDVGYLFKNPLTPIIRPGSIEDETINRFTKLWTNFARHGDPNPKNDDPLNYVKWKPVENHLMHFLDIGENLSVGVNPEYSRMKFWDEISDLARAGSKS